MASAAKSPKTTCFPEGSFGPFVTALVLDPAERFAYVGATDRLRRYPTSGPRVADPSWLPPDGAISISLDASRHLAYVASGANCPVAAHSTLPGAARIAGWDPARAPDGSCTLGVTGVTSHPSRVLVSGTFTEIGGPTRPKVAAFAHARPSLLAHYYRAILGREAESSGANFWSSEVDRVARLQVAPKEAYVAMATAFLSAPEFTATARSDEQFLSVLYEAFFQRTPDASGLAYWSSLLAEGLPREMVMFSFLFSPEFEAYIAAALSADGAMRPEVAVVVDFYRGTFARLPDDGGLRYWVNRFRSAQCIGGSSAYATARATAMEVANGFFNSAEYGLETVSTRDYVADLYNAFLRRGADLEGFRYWVSEIEEGRRGRDQVRAAFIDSPEFDARVRAVANASCAAPLP